MPQLEMKFSARVLVFRAQIGQVMTGVVNKVSNSHVGLLVRAISSTRLSRPICYPRIPITVRRTRLGHYPLMIRRYLWVRDLNLKSKQ